MDIIKTKSGSLAIRVYDKNGMKQLYSLRKIAVAGISAVTLAAAIATAPFIKYNIEMEQIQDLRIAAEKIEEMGSKSNIKINGENYFIPEEIREYADAKENLANSKYISDKDNIQKYEDEVKQESKDIYEISKQVIKDTVKPTFENPEAGEIRLDVIESNAGLTTTAKQYNKYGDSIKSKTLEGDFVHYAINNDISAQQLIEMMPETLESGEGIKAK